MESGATGSRSAAGLTVPRVATLVSWLGTLLREPFSPVLRDQEAHFAQAESTKPGLNRVRRIQDDSSIEYGQFVYLG